MTAPFGSVVMMDPMRSRRTAALSAVAVVPLVALLAGCGGSGDPEAADSGGASTDAASSALCDAAAESGAASEAVTVEGEAGQPATAEFETPLEVSAVERTVVTEGDGEALDEGSLVRFGFSAYSGESGEKLGTVGYEEGQLLPAAITADNPLGQVLGCAAPGTRVVAAFPANEQQQTKSEVYVFDLLEEVPSAAWGEEQDAVEGMPTVELADDGEPTITIPEGEAPAEVELATLKQGDGAEVEPGDEVLAHYRGVKWSDGSTFDSSWERGEPAPFQTSGVVAGFRQALEGQTVGSQVLVVIPPKAGYGQQKGHELEKETLVFVVDILGSRHLSQPTQ